MEYMSISFKKRMLALFIVFSILMPDAVFAATAPDIELLLSQHPIEHSADQYFEMPDYVPYTPLDTELGSEAPGDGIDYDNDYEPGTNGSGYDSEGRDDDYEEEYGDEEKSEAEYLNYAEFSPLSVQVYASDFNELEFAIASISLFAPNGEGVVVITNHIDFTNSILINLGGIITLLSDGGDWEIRNANANAEPAFILDGDSVLNLGWEDSFDGSLTITGFNTTASESPILINGSAVLNLFDGVSIYSNTSTRGGGVTVNSGGSFFMYGGAITNNQVGANDINVGGGVFVDGGTFHMMGGTIASNHAGSGGGVYTTDLATFIMTDGRIENNYANGHKSSHESTVGYGGGVLVGGGLFNMYGGEIDSNRTTQTGNGGGVAVLDGAVFNMSGSAEITNNEGRRMHGTPAGGNGSGVRVNSGSVFNMRGNALIADNRHTGSVNSWGAVSVEGTFNMYSGTITRNLSSNANSNAIHFHNSGIFNMRGGVIESNGNENSSANAILIGSGATFNMFDGILRDQNGAGMHLSGGTANISGGLITENREAGISISSNSEVNISGTARIYNNSRSDGGGMHIGGLSSTITMTGGTIARNRATGTGLSSGRGGGVWLGGTNNTFNMYGGTIENNTAYGITGGGGVYISTANAIFNMRGDAALQTARIERNHVANNARGGGVFVSSGTLNMQGGIIQNHTLTGSLSRGGGVAVSGLGTFLLAEGNTSAHYAAEIRHNSVDGIGGGVFIDSGGVMRMNTSAIHHNHAGLDGGGLGLGLLNDETMTTLERFNIALSNITIADIGGPGASVDNNTAGNSMRTNTLLEAANPQVAPTSGEGFNNSDIHSFLTVDLNVANHKLANNNLAGARTNIELEGIVTVSLYRASDIAEDRQFSGWIFTDDEGNIFTPANVSAETHITGRGWRTQFTMPAHNVTAAAIWNYWLTFSGSPEAGGTVTAAVNDAPVSNGVWVAEGSTVVVTGTTGSPAWSIYDTNYSGSAFEINNAGMPTSVVGTAPMTRASNFVVNFVQSPDREITIEVDEDGEVTITTPDWMDNLDYERNDDGTIVVVLPPGTDEEDVRVIIPEEDGWRYEIIEDENGELVVTITPPDHSPTFTVTFHLYINQESHSDLYDYFESYANATSNGFHAIVVSVIPGVDITEWPDQGLLNRALLDIRNIYGTETVVGHAFWGWFDDDMLDPARTGRALNATSGLRRPALADRCLLDYLDLLERIATADTDTAVTNLFGDAEGGNIDLYAIWSLWGDVDDNDEVDGTDVLLMDQYLFDRFMLMLGGEAYFNEPLNTRAGRVTIGSELTGDDVLRVDEYLFDRFMVMLGGEPYFGAVLGRAVPAAAMRRSTIDKQVGEPVATMAMRNLIQLSDAELVFSVPHITVPAGTTEAVLRIPFTHTGVARTQIFFDLGDFAPEYPMTFVNPVLAGIEGFGLPLVPQGGAVGTQRRVFMWNHGPQGPQDMLGSPTFNGYLDIRVVIPPGAPAGTVATVTLGRGVDNLAVGGAPVYVPQVVGSVTISEVEITTDDEGNVVVNVPPGIDYDIDTDDDGNTIVTFPPGQDIDEDDINVNLPPGWDYEIITDENGNIIVTITPPYDSETESPPAGGGGGSGGGWWSSTTTRPAPQTQQITEIAIETGSVSGVHHAFLIGFEDNTVQPGAVATRAQVATIFFRLMSDSDRARFWRQDNPFSDVELNDWFNNAVSTTSNAGIFIGMPDGTFQPHREVTRAELTAAVIRFIDMSENNAGENLFNDISDHWAAGYINIAARNSWVIGYEGIGGHFLPNNAVSRAEAVAIVNRVLGRLPESASDLLPGMLTWTDNANPNAWYYLYIQEATHSHYYVRVEDGIHEIWELLITPRAWEVLERPDSRPEDISRVAAY